MLAYKGISATRIIYVVNYICGLAGVLVKYVRRTGCKMMMRGLVVVKLIYPC